MTPPVSASRSTQQIWTVLHHDGPDHLGLRLGITGCSIHCLNATAVGDESVWWLLAALKRCCNLSVLPCMSSLWLETQDPVLLGGACGACFGPCGGVDTADAETFGFSAREFGCSIRLAGAETCGCGGLPPCRLSPSEGALRRLRCAHVRRLIHGRRRQQLGGPGGDPVVPRPGGLCVPTSCCPPLCPCCLLLRAENGWKRL